MEHTPVSQPLNSVRRIQHLCLRVRELQRSVDFYCGVLGFEERNGDACDKPGRICRLLDDETGVAFELLLTQGLPPGYYLVGLDHLAFDVASPATVESLHRRALEASFQAAQPRLHKGRWKSYLFDPDGYKIEISAIAQDEHGSGSGS
jgi:catechol 2,3-dioxygenase-like lactoylglutathione lyase family enzyme